MRMTGVFRTALAAGLLASTALPAKAQIYEIVGTRAQGMGGAFVAVADDATATWWNPAGLATGAYFSSVVERGSTTEPRETQAGRPRLAGRSEVVRGRVSGTRIELLPRTHQRNSSSDLYWGRRA